MSLESLHAYPFDTDPEYQAGLSSILGQFPADLSEEDRQATVLGAKCFYFSRKHNIDPPVDPESYKTYLQRTSNSFSAPQQSTPFAANATTTTTTETPPQPTYPPTFAELVELITQNKPIPGIEEIPDTVIPDESLLDYHPEPGQPNLGDTGAATIAAATPGGPSPHFGRRKPWEKDTQSTDTPAEALEANEPEIQDTAAAAGGGG